MKARLAVRLSFGAELSHDDIDRIVVGDDSGRRPAPPDRRNSEWS